MGLPQLNIKDSETSRLVRELAELTGETQTEAVRTAVRERLDRERKARDQHTAAQAKLQQRELARTLARIRRIQETIKASGLVGNMLSDDDLYDESGLPE
jgi:antitoxin VapB